MPFFFLRYCVPARALIFVRIWHYLGIRLFSRSMCDVFNPSYLSIWIFQDTRTVKALSLDSSSLRNRLNKHARNTLENLPTNIWVTIISSNVRYQIDVFSLIRCSVFNSNPHLISFYGLNLDSNNLDYPNYLK